MIGKQTKGTSFGGCVSYVLKEEKSKLLEAVGVEGTPEQMAEQFELQSLLNDKVKNIVGHTSLNFSLEDSERLKHAPGSAGAQPSSAPYALRLSFSGDSRMSRKTSTAQTRENTASTRKQACSPCVSQIAVRIGEKTIMASPVLAEQSPMARPFFRWNQRLIRIVAGIMEPKP